MYFIYEADIFKNCRQPNLCNFSTVQGTVKLPLPCGSCSYLLLLEGRRKKPYCSS